MTDCGDVNLERAQYILSAIGEVEDDIFKKRQNDEKRFRQNQRDKKRRMQQQQDGDMPGRMPEWMKSGPYAPMPLGRQFIPTNSSLSTVYNTDNKFEVLSKDNTADETVKEGEQSDEDKRGVKRKLNEAGATSSEADDAKKKSSDEPITHEKLVEAISKGITTVEGEEDEDANDPVRLWEDGWRGRYYKIKFNVSEDDQDFRHQVARQYAIGLIWVLKYYYQGVPAWNWYFPYHYAPFASDFVGIDDLEPDFDYESKPFKPFEQLMAVFPAASRKHLPVTWHNLMTDNQSPIIDFYPVDFQVDLNGKKQAWQGVALLPFVDEARLKKAIEPCLSLLTDEESKTLFNMIQPFITLKLVTLNRGAQYERK